MRNAVDSFFKAWGMRDAADRHASIAEIFSDQSTYADPRSNGALTGIDAIAAYVANFSENAPGWTAKVVKVDETAGALRATVVFGGQGPDGSDMVQHGQYFANFDGGKISRIVGFVGLGEPE